jgi:riboflavin kinase/FMN adenylyltransferase
MQRWRGLESVPSGWGRSVVTIGSYDGVHLGHQVIVKHTVDRARQAGLPAMVVTFDPHPLEVLRPGSHPPMLTTPKYKAELLEALGVDTLLVLPFTVEFSHLAPDEFVHLVLVANLHPVAVVVGRNFRFGSGAAGDVSLLRELGRRFGFAVEGVDLASTNGDTTLSSTYIRSCVQAGDVVAAARGLGRPHRVEGVVVRGDGRGRALGYPTANVEPTPYAAIPADGVYAGWCHRGEETWPAAISVGTNPTFAGRERRVEAYLLDVDVDLYGRHVGLDFVARLRDMVRFATSADLVAAIAGDVEATKAALAG